MSSRMPAVNLRANAVPIGLVGLILVLAGTLVVSSFRRPEMTFFPPSAVDPHEVGPRLVTGIYTVQAGDEEGWSFFDFSRGSAVEKPGPTQWDLGFRRFQIIVNGGEAFAGDGGVIDLGPVSYDSLATLPLEGYGVTEAGRDSIAPAIRRWYRYSMTAHTLAPHPNVYAVRTADGRHAKLRILSYYCPGATPGCLTFEYTYQGAGGVDVGRSSQGPLAPRGLPGPQGAWGAGPALPRPVANNAVATLRTAEGHAVFSFNGLDASKAWTGIVDWAFRWNLGDREWQEAAPVPGIGRLAGTAQGLGGLVYLFGGYTVAEDGSERSLPNVDVYHPETDTWISGAPIPVPTDDAVSGTWRDSLIYLVSGWHDRGNITDVQIYDPATDTWASATPIPGEPVFGHAGAIARDAIVYLDGAAVRTNPRRFTLEGAGWRGDIDPSDPESIAWSRLPDHPGPSLYRPAAGSWGDWVIFAGGTNNPYNYDGQGYDGVPSVPRTAVFAYNVVSGEWRGLESLPDPSMDHRGLLVVDGLLILVGGMEEGQVVSNRVVVGAVSDLLNEEDQP